MVAVIRYVAIGSGACQSQVVHPSTVVRLRSRPLDTPVRPSGTVMATSYVALSLGWLLQGKTVIAPTGSLATTAPSSVVTQPSTAKSGSM